MLKATRAMVAERAGVSVATVSYVLNNTRYVSPKLKDRIDKAIMELDYHPDMVARSMVMKKSNMLTIISNDLTNTMYGEIIMNFEKSAMNQGYFTNICSGYLNLKQYLSMMIARRIDGLFLCSLPSKVTTKDIDTLVGNGVSVACGNYLLKNEKRVNRIDLNYIDGMRQSVQHLFNLGHRQIAYANAFAKDYILDERIFGFASAMKDIVGGTQFMVDYGIGPEHMTEVEGFEVGLRMVEKFPQATAFVCTSDLFAYGVIQAIKSKGKRVPEDISVTGFENLKTSQFIDPPLTTISFDRAVFSESVVGMLVDSIKHNNIASKRVNMNLVVRASTCPPHGTSQFV